MACISSSMCFVPSYQYNRSSSVKQPEMTQICKTCGTKNSAYEAYCKVCQNVLEGTAILQSTDRKTSYHLPLLRPSTIAHLKEQPLWIIIPVVLIISTLLAT